MQVIQQRWKAILASVSVFISNVLAFYQAHQNLTLKQVIMSIIAAVVGGVIVHQIPNKDVK